MLVAYLQDTQLTVAVGTGGVPATVEKVLTCPNLNGMVRDGSIVDATSFQATVGEFWRTNGLETKDVKVVVRSRRITLQKIDAPVFRRQRDLIAYLGRETQVQVGSRLADPVTSYLEFRQDKPNNVTHVLAAVADKALVERIVTTFAAMGVTVTAVASPHTTGIALTRLLAQQHADETVLYVTADADQSLTTLFSHGQYEYSSEQHLFTDYGSADFGSELLRSVTNINQFMQSEHIATRYDRICLFGMDERATQTVRQTLTDYDAAVPIDVLPQDALFSGPGVPAADGGMQQSLPALWGLAAPEDGEGLVKVYQEASGTGMSHNERRDLLDALRAPAICLAACLVVIAGLGISNLLLSRHVDDLQAQTSTPAATQQLGAYLLAQQQSDTANATVDAANRLTGALDQYPVPGRTLETVIAGCAAGLVDCQTTGYDETSGSYIIEATATDNDTLSQFVQRLIQAGDSTGAFTVTNSGYQDEEVTGAEGEPAVTRWKMSVVLTLSQGEGR